MTNTSDTPQGSMILLSLQEARDEVRTLYFGDHMDAEAYRIMTHKINDSINLLLGIGDVTREEALHIPDLT